jgi:hypothetical protein
VTAFLLRGPGPVSVAAVARVRRLLTDGGSPLYGTDGFALREELHQICFLLRGGHPGAEAADRRR